MKMPLSWHKTSLDNMRATHVSYLKEIQDKQELAYALLFRIRVTEAQIAAAEIAGKDGFDPEKYLQPRTKV